MKEGVDMAFKLPQENKLIFRAELEEICRNSRMLESTQYIQHGSTSVFRHSVSVAYCAYGIAVRTHADVDVHSLIRGALLHDYFLYDWHVKSSEHKWHGFYHAEKSLENAMEDFTLNEIEKDMIRCHMFPLNLRVPKYKESWILCYADKLCSSGETADGFMQRFGKESRC